MRQLSTIILVALLGSFVASCNHHDPNEEMTAESKKLNTWFDSIWNAGVDRSPVWQTYLGIKKDYGSWGDQSDSNDLKEHNIGVAELDYFRTHFDPKKLDDKTNVSYRMWLANQEKDSTMWQYRYYSYPFDQMNGAHTWIPSFLINTHLVDSLKDAQDYISRINGINHLMDQLIDRAKAREERGIIMPKWCFPKTIGDCKNIITGAPFDNSKQDCPILEDFKAKINKLTNIDSTKKQELIAQANKALVDSMKPAYQKLIAYLTEEETKATDDDGVWKFPNGDKYYTALLDETNTTPVSPEEIYNTGLKEVARIQDEMRAIMKEVNFKSDSLQEFIHFMRTDKQFYYPDTDSGRQAYFDRSKAAIDSMKAHLDELFGIKPKAQLTIKRVEPFREKTAGTAFYESGTPDGKRPGVYYVNLSDMKQMPNFEIEALVHHEGIPGHHMQLSIAQELTGLPKFRTLGGDYTSFVEGWGLYSEYIPKEFGFYKDPYSDFGRLSMELFRACRMVVDVGIHYKKWTKQQGIDYYLKNSATSEAECIGMVERHIVMPAQATAYKVGQMKILELLNHSRQALGKKFDIRKFHDVVLGSGSVPLTILEENVNNWIAKEQAAK